jgi:ribosomal protein S18 acetylase RimI-like enzyme
VSRPVVHTRAATPDDLPTLLDLWDELRQVGARAERVVNPMSVVDVPTRLLEVLLDPDCRIVLATTDDDQPAGMVLLQAVRPDPLSDHKVVHIMHLVVSRGTRNRGVGHALVCSAADFASERHIEHVAASVYPSLRDANRFFARIGFAPVAVRRIAPVAVLRRRFDNERTPSLFADTLRRRTRVSRPVPPQRARRVAADRIET